jgi:hypothetical protein
VSTERASLLSSLRQMWKFGWWARLDTLGHALHVPQFILRPVCDRFEASLNDSFWISSSDTTTTSSASDVTWTWRRKDHRE